MNIFSCQVMTPNKFIHIWTFLMRGRPFWNKKRWKVCSIFRFLRLFSNFRLDGVGLVGTNGCPPSQTNNPPTSTPISHPSRHAGFFWSICLSGRKEVPSHLTLRKWFQCILVWILAAFCNCQFPYQSVCISIGRTWATSPPHHYHRRHISSIAAGGFLLVLVSLEEVLDTPLGPVRVWGPSVCVETRWILCFN